MVGAYAISKKVDAEKVKKILSFLNAMSSDEIWELANWGFKDVHYTKDGVMYAALEQSLKDKVSQTYMGQIASQAEKYFYAYNAPGSTKVRAEMNAKKIDEIMAGNYSLPDPTAGLVVESYNKISKELNKKLTDQMLKTILGGEKLDAWDAFAATLAGDATFKASLVDLNVAYTLKLAND